MTNNQRAARRREIRNWAIIVLMISALTLNIAYGVKSAIRMVDDPEPHYNRMKVKIVDDGQVAFLFYDQKVPYKVGDMFTYVVRDDNGAVVKMGPKVVVLELVEVDEAEVGPDANKKPVNKHHK